MIRTRLALTRRTVSLGFITPSCEIIQKPCHAHRSSTLRAVLIEPNVYVYYNATYQRNQEPPHYLPGRYSTDVLAETSVEFLEHAAADVDNRPFFINIMPVGPHFEKEIPTGPGQSIAGTVLYPPVPAKRHEHLFPNATIPRTENFNPETVSPPIF